MPIDFIAEETEAPKIDFVPDEEERQPEAAAAPRPPVPERPSQQRPPSFEPGELLPQERLPERTPEQKAFMETPLVNLPDVTPWQMKAATALGIPGAQTVENVTRAFTKPVVELAEAATSPEGLAMLPALVAAPMIAGPALAVPMIPEIPHGVEQTIAAAKAGDVPGAIESGVRTGLTTAMTAAGLGAPVVALMPRTRAALAETAAKAPEAPPKISETEPVSVDISKQPQPNNPDAISQREAEALPVQERTSVSPQVVEEVRQQAAPEVQVKEAEVVAEPPPLKQPGLTSEEMVGMGGAVPQEFSPTMRTSTGIKNAEVDKARAARGLEPIMKPATQAEQMVWERTMAKIDRDPGWQDTLIEELKTKPRNLSTDEILALDHRYVDLQNEYAKSTRLGEEAYRDKRMEDVAIAQEQTSMWEGKLTELEQIAQSTGAEWGRSGHMRQRLLKEDFTLEAMERKMRAAKGFKPLTEPERASIQKQFAEIEAKNKRLEEIGAEKDRLLAEAQMARTMAEMQTAAAKEGSKIPEQIQRIVTRVGEVLDQRADAARKRLEGKLFSLSPDVLKDIAEISASNIYHAGITFAEWSTKVIARFGEAVRPHLPSIWQTIQGDIKQANRTARAAGAVGAKAITPRYVAETVKSGESVLNFGAGKPDARTGKYLHSEIVKEKGANVSEYDFGDNQVGVLGRTHDTVFASNVLNVQSGEAMLRSTLEQIKNSTAANGRAVFNFPESPRYLTLTPDQVANVIQDVFGKEPKRVGGTKAAPLWEVDLAKGALEKIGEVLDRRAQAARERISGKLFSLSPDVLKDLAEIGAANIYHVGMDLAKWSAKMAQDLGERIQPHLKAVWEASLKVYDNTIDMAAGKSETPTKRRAKEIIRDNETPEGKTKKLVDKVQKSVAENADVRFAIQQLAKDFVQRGVRKHQELVESVHDVIKAVMPDDWTLSNTADAISGYGTVKLLNKGEVNVELRRMKGELQQLAKLRDMAEGKAPLRTGLERRIPSELEKEYIRAVNEAKKRGNYTVTNPDLQLRTAIDEVKKRLEGQIKEFERRLKEKDFSKRTPREVKLDKEALDLEQRREELKFKYHEELLRKKLADEAPLLKGLRRLREVWQLHRAFFTSLDFPVLRQGKFTTITNPKITAEALGPMFKSFASKAAEFKVEKEIRENPKYPRAQAAKLAITELHGPLNRMEEAYMSRLASHVPVVAGSQRAYVAFLNKVRMDKFDAMTAAIERKGVSTPEMDAVLAFHINALTGRGTIGSAERAAVVLNDIFFAPKFVASRFQVALGAPLYWGVASRKAKFLDTLPARKLIAMDYAKLLGAYGTFYSLLAMGAVGYGMDLLATDAGKLRFGNTRLDPLAGLSQVTVFLNRVIRGKKTTQSGKTVPIRGKKVPYGGERTMDVIARFARSKLSPKMALILDVAAGEDIIGQEVTPESVAKRMLVPIAAQDILELLEDQGVPRAIAFQLIQLLGENVQTYEDKKKR